MLRPARPCGRSSAGRRGSACRWRRTEADNSKPGARSSGPVVGESASATCSCSARRGPPIEVPQLAGQPPRVTGWFGDEHLEVRSHRPGPAEAPGCPVAARLPLGARPGGPGPGGVGERPAPRPSDRRPGPRPSPSARSRGRPGPCGSRSGASGGRGGARPGGSCPSRRSTPRPAATIRLRATRARFSLTPNREAMCTRWATGSSGGSSPSRVLARTDRAVKALLPS